MTALTSGIVSSAIFGVRNYDKGNNGHGIRYAVAAGQTKKVVDYVSQLDNVVGQTTKTATQALGAVSKNSVFLEGCGKIAKFSSNHINPLIVASAALDVAHSDNKAETAVKSATALGAMFTVENIMKKHLKDVSKLKCFEGVTSAINKCAQKTKYGKFIAPVLEGVAFVIGSCTAYSLGEKFGESLIASSKQQKSADNKMLF